MTVRPVFVAPALLGISILSGCVGVNPISAVVGMVGMSAANSIGMAQSAAISPAEQAKYDGMSCPQLRQLTANYETAQFAGPAPKKYGAMAPAGKMAITNQVIATRLALLKQLSASKGC